MTFYKCENSNGLIIFPIPPSSPLLISVFFFLLFWSDVHIVFVPMDLLKVAKYLHHTSHGLVHADTLHLWPLAHSIQSLHIVGQKRKNGRLTQRKRRENESKAMAENMEFCANISQVLHTQSHTISWNRQNAVPTSVRVQFIEFESFFFFTSKIVQSISMDMANHSRTYLLYSILFFVFSFLLPFPLFILFRSTHVSCVHINIAFSGRRPM